MEKDAMQKSSHVCQDLWPYENPNGTWNVLKATQAIHAICRWAAVPSALPVMEQLYKNQPELLSAMKKAVAEMSDLLYHTDNALGYHLTHITSGETIYVVYDNSEPVYTSSITDYYETEQEAKEAASKEADAKVEKSGDHWEVLHLDMDVTQDCWEHGWGGVVAGEYEDETEAEAELAKYAHGYIQEFAAVDYWGVISDKTGKNVFDMLFPSRTRALAFLYREINPPRWADYIAVAERPWTDDIAVHQRLCNERKEPVNE